MTNFAHEFRRTFIVDDRYRLFITGLNNTLILSLLSVLFGILIGLFVTYLNMSNFDSIKHIKLRRVIKFFSRIVSNIYLDVIRGTPVVIQLLVMVFVIFAGSSMNRLLIAAIAFGINSGAYVSEIIRAGILSIDKGQTEAGRSLGLSGFNTMRLVVVPQAIKNVLPALANEFIVLIKETAVVGAVAIIDITRSAQLIQSTTFSAAMPLLGSAVMYYVIIKVLSIAFKILEKHMRKSDKR
ncbi:MAG: amino acid ABC transporter permease [Defluviitaleaceae bacterium]|nr:amino acid ABC transporter permease [Defluviitaleaceae bacterium]